MREKACWGGGGGPLSLHTWGEGSLLLGAHEEDEAWGQIMVLRGVEVQFVYEHLFAFHKPALPGSLGRSHRSRVCTVGLHALSVYPHVPHTQSLDFRI